MARTAQAASPTKDKLMGAAQDLMLERGFTATTVDDICDKAGVTKGSFFHYFKSKDDLAKQVLGRFCAAGNKMHSKVTNARMSTRLLPRATKNSALCES